MIYYINIYNAHKWRLSEEIAGTKVAWTVFHLAH